MFSIPAIGYGIILKCTKTSLYRGNHFLSAHYRHFLEVLLKCICSHDFVMITNFSLAISKSACTHSPADCLSHSHQACCHLDQVWKKFDTRRTGVVSPEKGCIGHVNAKDVLA